MLSEFNLATIHEGIWAPIKKNKHHPLPSVRSKRLIDREEIYDAIIEEYQTHFRQLMNLYYVHDPKPSYTYRRLQIKISQDTSIYLYFHSDLPADMCMGLASHRPFTYQNYFIQPTRMSFIRKRNYKSIYDAGSDSRESSPEPQQPNVSYEIKKQITPIQRPF